ncbi:hypothetical protein [Frankia sp. AvcI1]|uniref:hypothetical protein n=1 Tax=Frankia sp. AvcI1 TaxID=573496 RepID=UPI001F18BD4F|nr:hypothetical protein [Frankia sp. AvcI1]
MFGLVLGLMTWLYFLAVVVVLAMEINAVRAGRLYPRALLTPFTDDVELTDSDRRAYTSYAKAEQFKSFQQVDVTFTDVPDQQLPADDPPPSAPGEGRAATAPAAGDPAPSAAADLDRGPRP